MGFTMEEMKDKKVVEALEGMPYRHKIAIPFESSHQIQREIGDWNFIHLPVITSALNNDDPFLSLNTVPGYVMASIAVYRTLVAAAREYIKRGENVTHMKLKSANFEFAAPVSFQGDIDSLLQNPTTSDVVFESKIRMHESAITGYYDAFFNARDTTMNFFAHDTKQDGLQGYRAVVEVVLDDPQGEEHTLPNGPDEVPTDRLEVPYPTPYKSDFDLFTRAVKQISISAEDRYARIPLNIADSALLPWYLAGMSTRIITHYIFNPKEAGPFTERFTELSDKLGFETITRTQLWTNLSQRLTDDTMKEADYLLLLEKLGIPEKIYISQRNVPIFKSLSYTGFTGEQNIQYGGNNSLDLSQFNRNKREFTTLFTGFAGEHYAYQLGTTFKENGSKALGKILRELNA